MFLRSISPVARGTSPLVVAALLAVLVLLPACSVLERTTDDDDEEPARLPPTEEPAEPENEPAPAPEEEEEDTGGARTVQGFRIQILTTDDKQAANERAAEAEKQWGGPVQVAWKAPYYRVRVGAFASRSSAQSTLETVKQQYPDALLVPDTVTIYSD